VSRLSHPPLAVEALIEKDGQILITKRAKSRDHEPGKWETITGRVEFGENWTDALAREVMEEVGLIVEVMQPISVFHFFRQPLNQEHWGVTFWCRYLSGRISLNLAEQERYKWVLPNQALRIITDPSLQRSIHAYIQASKIYL